MPSARQLSTRGSFPPADGTGSSPLIAWTKFDSVLVGIVVVSVTFSAIKGFTRELVSLGALIWGFLLACWFYPAVAGGLLPMVRQFTVRGMLMVWLPTRLAVNSFFRWLGFTDRAYANLLDMVYLGLRHFRMPIETARVMPAVVSDDALRTMTVPTLLLIGEHEVISNPARALERARRLLPEFEGELVPECRHDMVSSQRDVVDARVLDFLKNTRTDERAATAERSVA